MADRIILTVDGLEYSDWEQVEVRRSLEDAASSFSLTSAERSARLGPPIAIRPGSACVVAIDDGSLSLPVVTGYVDDCEISTDRDAHNASVTGRSKTADLIDCVADVPYTLRGVTLLQAANALGAPYGVIATESPSGASGAPLDLLKVEPDERVFEALERAARSRNALLHDDGEGQLVIRQVTDPGATVATLTMPGNIERATLRTSASGLFTNYEAIGQASGRDRDNFTPADLSRAGYAEDDTLARYRLLRVMLEGNVTQASSTDRARWEAATRAGRATLYTCTVTGWRIDIDGDVWEPGMLVHVADAYQGVDADLLLVDVSLTYGPDGTRAELSLAPLAGYLPESPVEYEAARASRPVARRKAQGGINLWHELDKPVEVTP
jgi:prophage tail gpP-like protein